MEIGAESLLFSTKVSSACLGTERLKVKSPVVLGFQTTSSVVLVIGSTLTSLVTSSPSDVLRVTVARYGEGIALSMVKGIRTAFPATPKVGASRLNSSTSGSRDALPT